MNTKEQHFLAFLSLWDSLPQSKMLQKQKVLSEEYFPGIYDVSENIVLTMFWR